MSITMNDKLKKLISVLLPSSICFFVGGYIGSIIAFRGVVVVAGIMGRASACLWGAICLSGIGCRSRLLDSNPVRQANCWRPDAGRCKVPHDFSEMGSQRVC